MFITSGLGAVFIMTWERNGGGGLVWVYVCMGVTCVCVGRRLWGSVCLLGRQVQYTILCKEGALPSHNFDV